MGALEAAGAAIPGITAPAEAFTTGVLQGSAVPTGLDALEATARGDLLQSNPFIDDLIDVTTSGIVDQINSRFAGAGRLGSTANQQAIARAVAPAALGVRSQAFESERGRQLSAAQGLFGSGFQAAGLTPSLAQASLLGPEAILRAGQGRLDLPFQALQRQASLINPIATGFGSTTQTTSTPGPDRTNQLLGLGAVVGGSLLGGPFGASLGKGLFG